MKRSSVSLAMKQKRDPVVGHGVGSLFLCRKAMKMPRLPRRKNTAERQENNLVPIRHPTPGHSSSSVTSYIRLSLPSTATTLVWVPSLANTRNTLTLAWQSVILNTTVIKLFIEMPHFPTRKTASLSLLKGYVACASYPIIPGAQYTEGTSDLSVHGPL